MSMQKIRALERAIVKELRAAMRGRPVTWGELAEQVGGSAESLTVRHLLGELQSCGVVEMVGERVQLSMSAQRLALIGMLSASEAPS